MILNSERHIAFNIGLIIAGCECSNVGLLIAVNFRLSMFSYLLVEFGLLFIFVPLGLIQSAFLIFILKKLDILSAE